MGLYLRVNHRLFRAQAAFMAALYVLLCTFGALTHVHPGALQFPSPSRAGSAKTSVGAGERHATCSATSYCAYCEWQASSVSVALARQTLSAPVLIGFASVPHRLTVATFDPPQSSSRAPPLA